VRGGIPGSVPFWKPRYRTVGMKPLKKCTSLERSIFLLSVLKIGVGSDSGDRTRFLMLKKRKTVGNYAIRFIIELQLHEGPPSSS
jgi:hypothetical protein